MAETIEITSPLKKWPGSVTLPGPDAFTGEQWNYWRDQVEQHASGTVNRLFCYAGLAFVARFGTWNVAEAGVAEDGSVTESKLPLETVRSWEGNPGAERMKLVSWFGREMDRYIGQVLDPKG